MVQGAFRMHGRMMLLQRGGENAVTIVIKTSKPMAWWDHVISHAQEIHEAVHKYSGEDASDSVFVAMYEFNDEAIVALSKQALEEANDDEARAGNPHFKLLSEVVGIVTGSEQ